MTEDKLKYEFKVEICFSPWKKDRIGYCPSQKFLRKCTSEEDQKAIIVRFQKEHDVLIWWIIKWKTRISISDWFD